MLLNRRIVLTVFLFNTLISFPVSQHYPQTLLAVMVMI
jgi:hypothetical protein